MIKVKELLYAALLTFWAVVAPIHSVIFAMLALVFIDLATGLWKARWPHDPAKRVPITSAGLRGTTAKLIPYMVVLLVGFAVDRGLGFSESLCTRAAAAGLFLTESVSIDENLGIILGYRPLSGLIEKLRPAPKDKNG